MTRVIDLNCDLGEAPARITDDLALLDIVSSANIACGGHAGDDSSMRAIVRTAIARGVAIGAHPSYPDRANFGRREMPLSISDLKSQISDQVSALARIARSEGASIRHVKPHGALYHAANTRPEVARALADVARQFTPTPILVGLAGGPALDVWRAMNLAVIAEAFADRRYESDGSLRAREHADALITDEDESAAQALSIALDRRATTRGGTTVGIEADSLCVHSDTPGSVAAARAVHHALESRGVVLAPARGR